MKIYWIICAVRKHVVTNQALAGGCKGIGVDESANVGIVVTGLQVVQSGFSDTACAAGAKTAGSVLQFNLIYWLVCSENDYLTSSNVRQMIILLTPAFRTLT